MLLVFFLFFFSFHFSQNDGWNSGTLFFAGLNATPSRASNTALEAGLELRPSNEILPSSEVCLKCGHYLSKVDSHCLSR